MPYVGPEDFELGDMKNAFCIYSASCKVDHLARLAEKLIGTRVSRVVGGWAKWAKKCLTPSKIKNSKKWSRVSLRMLWNRVTMARS